MTRDSDRLPSEGWNGPLACQMLSLMSRELARGLLELLINGKVGPFLCSRCSLAVPVTATQSFTVARQGNPFKNWQSPA